MIFCFVPFTDYETELREMRRTNQQLRQGINVLKKEIRVMRNKSITRKRKMTQMTYQLKKLKNGL